MRIYLRPAALVLLCSAAAQAQSESAPRDLAATRFFDSEAPLTLTFTANIRRLRGDKGEDVPWHAASISYTDAGGAEVVVPARVRTRGLWRLKNCEFPPVRLNFARETSEQSVFSGLDRPKLASYCRNDNTHEQYVLQEYQVYRIYQLLTPTGHRARLARVTYADSGSQKPLATRWAFILDEPRAMAARLGGVLLESKGAKGDDLEPFHNALVGVFQYLIGNTDFSIAGLHNIELVARPDGVVFPVPYDFDFSGVVNARYATVDPQLSVRRVRDRLFRGYCASPEEYEKVFALFREKKDAIYGLYRDSIGELMDRRIVEETLRYYDDFYRTIDNPGSAKRQIVNACLRR